MQRGTCTRRLAPLEGLAVDGKNGRAAGIKLLDKDVNQILRGNSTDIQKGGRVMRGMEI